MTRATMHRIAAELRDAGLSVMQARTLALRRRDTRMCYEIRPVRYYLSASGDIVTATWVQLSTDWIQIAGPGYAGRRFPATRSGLSVALAYLMAHHVSVAEARVQVRPGSYGAAWMVMERESRERIGLTQ